MGIPWDQPGADPLGDIKEWLRVGREHLPGGALYEHRHWPASYEAGGSKQRPIYVCSCGDSIAVEEASGRFRSVIAASGEWI